MSTPPHIWPHCFPFTVEEPEVPKGSRAALLCSAEAASSLYNPTLFYTAHSLEAAHALEVSCNTHKCSCVIITSGLKSSTAHRAQPWNPLRKTLLWFEWNLAFLQSIVTYLISNFHVVIMPSVHFKEPCTGSVFCHHCLKMLTNECIR